MDNYDKDELLREIDAELEALQVTTEALRQSGFKHLASHVDHTRFKLQRKIREVLS